MGEEAEVNDIERKSKYKCYVFTDSLANDLTFIRITF